MSAPSVEILYILGAGHCGSTLLSLMLDRHPKVVAVSEIIGLNAASPGMAGTDTYSEVEFWQKVASHYEARSGKSFWKVRFQPPARRQGIGYRNEWLNDNRIAFESIAKTSGKRIVADASKQPGRLRTLLDLNDVRIRVVYLVRDARAVVHAYDRKYASMALGVRKLARLNRRARQVRSRVLPENRLVLRYEDLASNTEATLRRLCNFLDIEFEPNMLSPDTSCFTGIGGNRLRNKPIRSITLDESWRTDMPRLKLNLVSLFFFRYNSVHGYRQ